MTECLLQYPNYKLQQISDKNSDRDSEIMFIFISALFSEVQKIFLKNIENEFTIQVYGGAFGCFTPERVVVTSTV